MAMKIADLGISEQGKAGQWFSLPGGGKRSKVQVLLNSTENEDYREYTEDRAHKITNSNLIKLKGGGRQKEVTLTPAEDAAIQIEALAKFILIGWEGVDGADGKPAPCNLVNKKIRYKNYFFH